MAALHKMHSQAERMKWVEISSRLYDKTGKRVDPEVLKGKFGG